MMWNKAIEKHYRSACGVDPEICTLPVCPHHQLSDHLAVQRYPPHVIGRVWPFATRGMSRPNDPKPLELHMLSPCPSNAMTELLVATAHYHRTGAVLDLGHSVNFGRPWLDNSLCEYGLISLPYLDGPTLEIMKFNESAAHFYWLIPITKAELEYKKQNGLDALEAQFERTGFHYADPHRSSVV